MATLSSKHITSLYKPLIVVFMMSLQSVQAHATVACDVFLASVISESGGQDLAASGSHPYLRVIEYYIKEKQLTHEEATTLMAQISEAQEPVNPLRVKKDPLSILASQALDKLLPTIKKAEWLSIQKGGRKVAKKSKAESSDRAKQKEETSHIFKPKIVQDFMLVGTQPDNMSWFSSSKGTFLSILVRNELYIYKLEAGQLTKIHEITFNKDDAQVIGFSWFVVGKRVLLSVKLATTEKIELYEFKNKSLKKMSEIENLGRFNTQMQWHTLNGRTFLFAYTSGRRAIDGNKDLWSTFTSYELENNELIVQEELELGKTGLLPYDFVRSGDRVFLVLKNFNRLILYDMTRGLFSKIFDTLPINDDPFYSSVTFTTDDNGQVYLAAASKVKLYVYALVDDKLVLIDQKKSVQSHYRRPVWVKDQGRLHIIVAREEKNIDYYELTQTSLIKKNVIPEQYRGGQPFVFQDENYFADTTANKEINFFSLSDDIATPRAQLPVPPTTGDKNLKWVEHDGQIYIAVDDFFGSVSLIKAFNKVTY